MDAGGDALRRVVLETGLPSQLRVMYPAWRIWETAGRWHACRRGNFRQVYEPGVPQFAVHADSPAGLWAALVSEMDKENTLPILVDAGDDEYGIEVTSRPPRPVHKHGSSGRDVISAERNLRSL